MPVKSVLKCANSVSSLRISTYVAWMTHFAGPAAFECRTGLEKSDFADPALCFTWILPLPASGSAGDVRLGQEGAVSPLTLVPDSPTHQLATNLRLPDKCVRTTATDGVLG